MAVPRSFKNSNGEYDTDFIDCTLWDMVARSTTDYCHKGDIIAVKGRIQTRVIEKLDQPKKFYQEGMPKKQHFYLARKQINLFFYMNKI